jgi:hypothetical protein
MCVMTTITIPDNIKGGVKKYIRDYLIRYSMEKFHCNRTKAARWLGESLRNMRYILKKYPEYKNERCYLNAHRLKLLPKTFEECKKKSFYVYGSEKLKKELEDYYDQKNK